MIYNLTDLIPQTPGFGDLAMGRLVVMLGLAVLLPGCAMLGELLRGPEDMVALTIEPDPLYEELVDYYVELCAISQYRPLGAPLGGIPGHAVMYLKGACRDESAGYPRLRPCAQAETDTSSHEHGAGVSVNRWFKNVNWVATPGKRLFYDGNLGRYQTLDQAHLTATAQEAVDLGLYRGIELHPKPEQDAPPPMTEFVREDSLGTDFALRYGRSVFCTRIPMEPTMMQDTMDYLNALNDEYQKGDVDYNWSGYSDNCVHTLHNALAAAGIWKPKSVRAVKIRQFFNIAVPANTVIELAKLSNGYPIEDFSKIRGDEVRWHKLVEGGWLPAAPGSLVQVLAVHQENELYDSKYRLFVLEGWFSASTSKRATELLSDGRYTSVDANLRFFRNRYQRILAEREDPGVLDKVRGSNYLEDRRIYYDYIASQLEVVKQSIEQLNGLDQERTKRIEEAMEAWEVDRTH